MNKNFLKDLIIKEVENESLKHPDMKEDFLKILNFIINRPDENKEALLICHLGLGDLISHIGSIIYLSFFYNKLYVTCAWNNYDNIKSFLQDYDNVYLLKCDNTIMETEYISKEHPSKDVFRAYLKHHNQRVKTNNIFLDKRKDKFISVNNFVSTFYNNINMSFEIYYKYFSLPNTENAENLYNSVKNYNIIFCHEKSSDKFFDFSNKIINEENNIVICANRNYYKEGFKKDLAEKFVNIPLIDYNLVILNASKIIVCDSCFSAIVIPYKIKGEIKTDDIEVYCRNNWGYETLTNKVKFIY